MRSQLTKLTQTLSVREPGKFPSQPNSNPIGQAHKAKRSSSENHGQVQSVTILRSVNIIEKPEDPRTVWPTTCKKNQGHDEENDDEVKEGSKEGKKKAEEEEREQERKQKEKGKSVEERSKFEPRPPFPKN